MKKKYISSGVMIDKRHAHVVYNKEFNMYLVRMFENNKLIKSVPMISDAFGHGVFIVRDLQKM